MRERMRTTWNACQQAGARTAGAVRAWCVARRHLVVPAAVAALVLIGGGTWLHARWSATPLPPQRTPGVPAPAVATKPRWLDGLPLPTDAPQPLAVAVSVDNAPEARPQTGLAHAPLVFVLPVEGQRARYLAVFEAGEERAGSDDVACDAFACSGFYAGDVGPIRSARAYFVGLADALGVPIAHAGGSPAAIELLKTRAHVDEWYRSPYHRSRSRVAPFNLYGAVPAITEFLAERAHLGAPRADAWKLWPFSDVAFDGVRDGESVALRSGGERAFAVSWTYDEHLGGRYVRLQGGQLQYDIGGVQVSAENVVVLRVDASVLDRVGRLAIPQLDPPVPASLFPRMPALVLSGGHRSEGTWGWEDPAGDAGLFGLRHENTEGTAGATAPILLAPGRTWVEVVTGPFPGE